MKAFLLFILISFSSLFGQTKSETYSIYSYSIDTSSIQKPTFDYKKINFSAFAFNLQVYNPSIGLLENFNFKRENQFEKTDKMTLVYFNNQYFTSSSLPLFTPFLNTRKDSFNPSGAVDFKSAIGVGLLNFLLNKK